MSGQHTKGPWRVVVHDDEAYILDAGNAPQGITSIRLNGTGMSREESLANAARIVQCVNSHEELIELVQEMFELADNWPGIAHTAVLEQRVRAAIAAASDDAQTAHEQPKEIGNV